MLQCTCVRAECRRVRTATLHAVRSAITATAELLVCASDPTPIPPKFRGVPVAPDRPYWGQRARGP